MAFARYERALTDEVGDIIMHAFVEVRREAPGFPLQPQLYEDFDGASGLTNPIEVTDGILAFHAVGGFYRLEITAPGHAPRTMRYVPLGTAAAIDVDAYATAGFTWAPESATTAPPTAGCIRANNADWDVADRWYIHHATLGGSDVEDWLLETTFGDTLFLSTGVGIEISVAVTGATNHNDYIEIEVSDYVGPSGLSLGDSGFVTIGRIHQGMGVPTGGVAGQKLVKSSGADYDTHWVDDIAGFATKAIAEAFTPAVAPDFIRIEGYSSAGDAGGALYKKVGAQPTHPGKLQIGVGTGAWYEVAEAILTPQMFGAKGDGTTNDEAALNNLALCARAVLSRIFVPRVTTFYLTSGTVTLDWTLIPFIAMDGEVRGNYSSQAIPAVQIGGAGTDRGELLIRVRNSTDGSVVDGNYGVDLKTINSADIYLDIRGFDKGVRLDGTGASAAFVDNNFHIKRLYNNGCQVFFDFANASYATANKFWGGTFFLGTGVTKADRGSVKIVAAGTSLVAENVFHDSEIGITGGSMASDFAVLADIDITSSSTNHSIFFKDTRAELYSGPTDPVGFNISVTGSGQVTAVVEFVQSILGLVTVASAQQNIRVSMEDKTRRDGLSTNTQRTSAIAPPLRPYRFGNNVGVPEYTIFDPAVGYGAPSQFITTGLSSRTTKVIDGRLFVTDTTIAVGKKYTKSTQPAFLRLTGKGEVVKNLVVICYDASGNVLSGTSPYYVQGRQLRSQTRGAVTLYEAVTDWLWIDRRVVSFFIGEARWSSGAGEIKGIDFDVYLGRVEGQVTRDDAPAGRIASAIPTAAYEKVGAAVDGTATNGWRNTFALDTALSVAAASSATSITVTTVTGIANGDTIGIEIDTALFTGEQQIHWTTVSGAPAGSVVTLANALPAAAAVGRRVLVNRWVAK